MNLSTNSKQYAKKLGKKPIAQPMIPNKDDLNYRDPITVYDQITPIDPVRSSKNWATESPSRGFNMDDLNTYVIRPSDRKQAELFDRFILGDASRLFGRDTKRTTLGTMIGDKLGPANSSTKVTPSNIKHHARMNLKGNTYDGIKNLKEK